MKRLSFAGQRVVIVGLARQGTALARFFCAQGAQVVVTDARTEPELRQQLVALNGLPIEYALGEHPYELLEGSDLVCLSGGVPPEAPFPQEAQKRGIPLSNDSLLTLYLTTAPVIGVTGSSGKTTTTTLLGRMLEASGFETWVGGNIGTPLIDRVREIPGSSQIVLELSSFQLQLFAGTTHPAYPPASPHISLTLNVTPNHLDRHPSMAHYTAAKANIHQFQSADDIAVLGADDRVTGQWWRERRVDIEADEGQPAIHFALAAHTSAFSLEHAVPEAHILKGDRLLLRTGEREVEICSTADLKLLGRHNVANVLAACAAGGAAGAHPEAMRQMATTFSGVAHRLELVREANDVFWYNDSIATTPERVVAALASFDGPIILLAGGRDKHLPWDAMADLTMEKVRHLVLFGEAAELIAGKIAGARARGPVPSSLRVDRCDELEEAVETAARVARPGDSVLLSPGGTSFDAYADFEQRGDHFRELVRALG